jgi:hypothetical protein
MYKFTTPYVEEGPAGTGPLFSRYRLNRGVSVLNINGEYYEMRYPTEDDIASADVFYRGGNDHIVSDSIAQDLLALGYTVVPI